MKKRVIASGIALCLTLGLLAACGGSQGGEGSDNGTGTGDEKVTVRILKAKAANEVSYDDMFIWEEMGDRFGINFEFDNPAEADFLTRYNLMLANPDELPDVIMNMPLEDITKNADGDIIMPLNDLLESKGKNLNALMDANENIRKALTFPDGNIYYYPMIDETPSGNMPFGVRVDWMERLGIEDLPETIEDWEAYWALVKSEDVNQNGNANDEIPFSAGDMGSVRAFAAAWGIVDDYSKMTNNFYKDADGETVKFGPIQPEYKDFLIWINRMYESGYIDPQIVTMTGDIFSGAMAQDLVGSTRGPLGGYFATFNTSLPSKIEGFSLRATSPPSGPSEAKIHINIDLVPRALVGATITTASENADVIAEWIDWMYGEEGSVYVSMGKEGVTYEETEDGLIFTDSIMKNPDGLSPKQAVGTFSFSQSSGPFLFNKYNSRNIDDDSVNDAKVNHIIPFLEESNKYMLPGSLSFDSNDAETVRSKMTNIKDQAILQFMTGQRSIDEFDAYVADVEGMGIQDVMDVFQKAYDDWK